MATPATSLGSDHRLRIPEIMLGQKVKPGPQWDRNLSYYLKCYALHLIREHRRICWTKGRIPLYAKEQIRNCLTLFREAKEFEVAGLLVRHGFNLNSTRFSACYLAGVLGAASPPRYGVQLVIRFERNGNKCALLTSDFGVSPDDLVPVLAEE